MSAHRYWRVYIARNAGDGSWIQFAEVEMRTVAGGADQCVGGTPACSPGLQSGSAAGIFADDGLTSWAQWGGTTDKWCSYDFGAGNEKDIVQIAMMGGVGGANRVLGHGWVQWSDDNINWTTAWAISYTGGYVSGTNVLFTKPADADKRYWRLRPLGGSWNNVWSMSRLEMRLTEGGADQCAGGTAIAYANNGTNLPAHAFDGNTATLYATTIAACPDYEYIGYDFGAGNNRDIRSVAISPRQDGFFMQWPKAGVAIESGPDGINWLPRWSPNNLLNPGPSGNNVIEVLDPTIAVGGSDYRFWGIAVTALQAGTAFGIDELEIRDNFGTGDMTSGAFGLATSSYDTGTAPEFAFDGSASPHASADPWGGLHRLVYDFGRLNRKPTPLQLMLKARAAGSFSLHNQAPSSFKLIKSNDGHNWTDHQTFLPNTWVSASSQTFDVTGAAAGTWTIVHSTTPDADSGAWNGYTARMRLPAANLLDTAGSKLRFTITAGLSEGITVTDLFVGVEGGTAFSFAAPPTRVTFGGANGANAPAGAVLVSDGVDFAYTGTEHLVVAAYFNGGGASDTFRRASDANANGATAQYKVANDASNTAPAGYTTWDGGAGRAFTSKIESYQAPAGGGGGGASRARQILVG